MVNEFLFLIENNDIINNNIYFHKILNNLSSLKRIETKTDLQFILKQFIYISFDFLQNDKKENKYIILLYQLFMEYRTFHSYFHNYPILSIFSINNNNNSTLYSSCSSS